MNGIQLVERLINNLEMVLHTTAVVRPLEIYQRDMADFSFGKRVDDFSIEESWASTTLGVTIPSAIKTILSYINLHGSVITPGDYQPDFFTILIRENTAAIADSFQKTIDSKTLIDISTKELVSAQLYDELENFHEEAIRLRRCYDILVSKR